MDKLQDKGLLPLLKRYPLSALMNHWAYANEAPCKQVAHCTGGALHAL